MESYPNFELPLKNLANIFSVLDFIQIGEAARDALGAAWLEQHGNIGASSDFAWEQIRSIAARSPKQIVILVHLYPLRPTSAREHNENFFTITLPEHIDQNTFTQYVSSNAPADAKGNLKSILNIPGAQICDLWNNNFIGLPTKEELSKAHNLYSSNSNKIAVRMVRVDRTEILNLFDGLFNSPDLARRVSPDVRQQVKAVYAESLKFTCGTEEKKLRNHPYCSIFAKKVRDDSSVELSLNKIVFAANSTLKG